MCEILSAERFAVASHQNDGSYRGFADDFIHVDVAFLGDFDSFNLIFDVVEGEFCFVIDFIKIFEDGR